MSITLDDIKAARTRIADHVRRTPLGPSPWLSDATGGQILLKAESLQTTSSFKLRGALNAIGGLLERTQGPAPRVVTVSAGNHGRAMAWAAEQLGVALTVFTSREAPRTKRDAIRRHGADLEDRAPAYDDAERLAKAFARETGATFISPYNDADVIAGAGTIGLELVEDAPEARQILVPVGGGGLVSGIAIAVKALAPTVRIVGVEVEASHPFQTSLAAGRITEITVGDTIADGLSGNLDADAMTFAIVRDRVDATVLVSEAALRRGIRGLIAHEHLIAEGAGIAAVAALLERRVEPGPDPTVALVSGANIDFDRLQGILAEA